MSVIDVNNPLIGVCNPLIDVSNALMDVYTSVSDLWWRYMGIRITEEGKRSPSTCLEVSGKAEESGFRKGRRRGE